MPRDALSTDVEAWFAKAREDMRLAEVALALDPPPRGPAAFHCQQAAEKALKGLLLRRGVVFPKTHDIGAVAQLLPARDADLEPLMRRASRLTAYAWMFRYPGDLFEPPADEIAEALATATEVVDTLEPRAMAEAAEGE
jgi:HEPN domain-containing protein